MARPQQSHQSQSSAVQENTGTRVIDQDNKKHAKDSAEDRAAVIQFGKSKGMKVAQVLANYASVRDQWVASKNPSNVQDDSEEGQDHGPESNLLVAYSKTSKQPLEAYRYKSKRGRSSDMEGWQEALTEQVFSKHDIMPQEIGFQVMTPQQEKLVRMTGTKEWVQALNDWETLEVKQPSVKASK